VSPLLANIALHGLETAIRQAFPRTKMIQGKQREWQPYVIRYADDFVACMRMKPLSNMFNSLSILG